MESSAAPQPEANFAGKIRILLQTITHLVPGTDRQEKITFIKNAVCQRHWQRDYDSAQERIFLYGDDFGLKNRRCFFLIDHHGFDHTIQEEKVPVVGYEWTGESLVRIHEEPPSRIQEELKKWPFTWEGRKFHRLPKGPDGKYDPKDRRDIIKSSLYLGIPIVEDQLKFLREYPEHAKWLRTHLDHQLWVKIEPFCDLPGEAE
ncbi:hypothetical protein AK830_g7236 [Neonectria ditissima]|uniref:Uncharacterized protein n=1 Tax=Neonectria ditissima TaxID=78410 RepID=A0A0P7BG51_9HYPO|nr:hypothetical protein AK830_g7236 [Neonectria ditissima]